MAFKNLEQRFNEKVNELYAAATTKFDNGRASNGRNDEPLIVRKPGKGYFTTADRIGGRSIPLNSSLQDVKRLTLFTLSVRGLAFLAKQQLLQTGNSFEQTRIINPVFAVGNAVPFLHLRRHLRPLTGGPGGPLIGKTDTSYANVRRIGQLQKETYDKFTNEKSPSSFIKKIPVIGQTISAITAKKNIGEELGYEEAGWAQTRPELGKTAKDYFVSNLLLNELRNTSGQPATSNSNRVTGLFNKIKQATTGKNAAVARVGFLFGGKVYTDTFFKQNYGPFSNGNYTTYIKDTDGQSKFPPRTTRKHVPFNESVDDITSHTDPAISSIADINSLKQKYDTFQFENGTQISTVLNNTSGEYITRRNDWYKAETGDDVESMPYLKYFTGDVESITSGDKTNARDLARDRTGKGKKISYIKDPSNINEKLQRNVLEPYKYINGADDGFDDAITVSFAIGRNDPIKFRAFITELNENSSPQYQSFQYIGRVEKFINYTGVQREASFKLGILAFSKDELESVWRRINYLTGLTFPYGFTKGILQPNIVRLTIGNVYNDQPGYISSLSKTFNQLGETWDLDAQVPIAATLDMKFTIIEKATKVADSPFHGITETMDGFAPTINVAQTLNSLNALNNPPAIAPIVTRVEERKPTIPTDGLSRLVNVLPPPGVIKVPIVNIPIGT
jgi:hypothetical protein